MLGVPQDSKKRGYRKRRDKRKAQDGRGNFHIEREASPVGQNCVIQSPAVFGPYEFSRNTVTPPVAKNVGLTQRLPGIHVGVAQPPERQLKSPSAHKKQHANQ